MQPAQRSAISKSFESGDSRLQAGKRFVQNTRHRLGIENTDDLEGRLLIEGPGALHASGLEEAPAQAKAASPASRAAAPAGSAEKQREAVGDDIGDGQMTMGDGVAAIEALAEGEVPASGAGFEAGFEGLRAHDGVDDGKLGKGNPMFLRNGRDQAPPARTAASQAIGPLSVTTELNRPARSQRHARRSAS